MSTSKPYSRISKFRPKYNGYPCRGSSENSRTLVLAIRRSMYTRDVYDFARAVLLADYPEACLEGGGVPRCAMGWKRNASMPGIVSKSEPLCKERGS